ncbi:PapB/FocB family fimbrial expression transcriptional regulator [Escherichia coli]|uniref:PapB/FocB family fimbrial expression transcriptional regulator n=1 Tax=Escherichia coli TaxID=562 RepID=UPI003AF2117F
MSEMHFFLLIGISSIHSDRVILAMKDYLVGGHSRKEVCEKYQMNNGYFSTTLGRLIRLNVLQQGLHLIIQMSHRHLTKLWHSGVSGR